MRSWFKVGLWLVASSPLCFLSGGGKAAALPLAPAGEPIVSALVTVAGPSVYMSLAGWGGRPGLAARAKLPLTGDPVQVRQVARRLAPQLVAAEADVARRQAPVVAAAARMGMRVIGRYATAANGLLVHGTARQLRDLAGVPGVVDVEPAPLFHLALSNSVPYIGADALAAQMGYRGQDTTIAIIDTGMDYTHASLGGSGDPAQYGAAAQAINVITDTWQGKPMFPNDKVVGGWDFVGANYTSPDHCSPSAEQAGQCTSTPHPDPDPFDGHNHGSHVAGIAAGIGASAVYHGVAPAAKLVALKVYGPPMRAGDTDETVDVVVDAIEWCARVNLAQPVSGTVPAGPIDVINMSLGEDFGQGSRLFDAAVDAANGAGIVVVASAGNSSNRPFVLGAPGASPHILSVASSAAVDGPNGSKIDVISSFSSRGPSKNGALKPDISAPGAGIVSVLRGSGIAGIALSGTSMASPHVAGAAAVIRSRDRAEGLELTALDRAALLMNYAQPTVFDTAAASMPSSVVRQGAGRLDVLRAGTGKILVRTGDIASVNLGTLSLAAEQSTDVRILKTRNLSATAMYVQPSASFTNPDDAQRGLAVEVSNEPLFLPPHAEIEVPVTFHWQPAGLRDWTVRGSVFVSSDTMTQLALEGLIGLTPVNANGRPLTGELTPTVPFYALPRRASAISASSFALPGGGHDGRLELANRGFSGMAELYHVPQGALPEDPAEAGAFHELDLARVGVRFEPAPVPGGQGWLSFALVLHEPAPWPQVASTELYLDTDRDGRPDIRIRSASDSALAGQPATNADTMSVGVARWDPATNNWPSTDQITGQQPLDLNARIVQIRVPLAAIGMNEPQPFDFYVIRRGLNEDWLHGLKFDVAPDGADSAGPQAPRYHVNPAAWAWQPEAWSLAVPAAAGGQPGSATVALTSTGTGGGAVGGGPDARLSARAMLMLMPDGRFEDKYGMAALVMPSSGGEPVLIYLPYAARRHNRDSRTGRGEAF